MTDIGGPTGSPPPIELTMDPGILPVVRLGCVQGAPVAVGPRGEGLDEVIADTCRDLTQRYRGRPPGEIDGLARARDLYRAFGIDPTKHRPSSESLLRRVLLGKGFPAILNAVDLCNLLALRFLLSLGLYDVERLEPPVLLRRGRAGEVYEGIRKDSVHLEGRPVLVDARGPFGNPTSDSLRTAVTTDTRSIWMVIFAPAGYPGDRLRDHVRESRASFERYLAPPGETVRTTGSLLPG